MNNASLRPPAPAANASAEEDELNVPELQTSPAVRQFRHGDLLDYGVVIFNAKPGKTTQQPQLAMQVRLLRDGQPVFTTTSQAIQFDGQTDLQRIAYAGRMKFGTDLAPGDYVMQVIVTDSNANNKYAVATQWTEIEILPSPTTKPR